MAAKKPEKLKVSEKIKVRVEVRYEGAFDVEMTPDEYAAACEAVDKPGGVEPEDFGWFDFESIVNTLRGEVTDIEAK